jgi:3-oxoadipate CoA-transferase beta subunit
MMSLFTRGGGSKLVPKCTYPLAGLACVSRVYTEYGVFASGPDGVRVLSTAGITAEELQARIPVELHW